MKEKDLYYGIARLGGYSPLQRLIVIEFLRLSEISVEGPFKVKATYSSLAAALGVGVTFVIHALNDLLEDGIMRMDELDVYHVDFEKLKGLIDGLDGIDENLTNLDGITENHLDTSMESMKIDDGLDGIDENSINLDEITENLGKEERMVFGEMLNIGRKTKDRWFRFCFARQSKILGCEASLISDTIKKLVGMGVISVENHTIPNLYRFNKKVLEC